MSYGHFKFVIMLFRLMNALIVFMDLINRVFHDCLNKFIIVFIDDILVYFKSHKETQPTLENYIAKVKIETIIC